VTGIDYHAERRRHADRTLAHFTGLGFTQISQQPIVPYRDKSILFTNSAIVDFKPYFNPVITPRPGVAVLQRCFRAHALKDLSDEGVAQNLLCHFTMAGAYVVPDRAVEFATEVHALLTGELGMPPERLRFMVSSEDTELGEALRATGVELDVDSQPMDFYRWTFGMPGVWGRGASLAVMGESGPRGFGNIIQVVRDGITVGYGYGAGIEATVAARYELPRFVQASPISMFFPTGNPLETRIADLLVGSVLLYRAGVRPGRKSRENVLQQMLKAVSDLCAKAGIKPSEHRDALAGFEEYEFGNQTGVADRVIAGLP
jgi:tRNA synthetases class II (A)